MSKRRTSGRRQWDEETTPAFTPVLWVAVYWLINKAYTHHTKVTLSLFLPPPLLVIAYFIWHRAGKCEVKSPVRARVYVQMRRARHGEDDSKCHSVVWGQPSQTHWSCRGCCHPPPHCLCKWCLQSPSNMWSFFALPPSLSFSVFASNRTNCPRRPSAPAPPPRLHSRGSTGIDFPDSDDGSDAEHKGWAWN